MRDSSRIVFILIGLLAGAYLGLALLIFIFPAKGGETLPERLGTMMEVSYLLSGLAVTLGLAALGALASYSLFLRRSLGQKGMKLEAALEVNRTKDEFISMVLHHLRTPLSGVKWSLKQLLKEEVIGGDGRTKLERLFEENNRALSAVEHLIGASQASMGRIEYRFEIISLEELRGFILEALAGLSPLAQARNLSVAIKMPPPSKNSIKIDKEKVITIVQTLFDNAIRYTPDGGSIEISTQEQEANFLFSLADTGMGIPEKDQSRVFLQFFRAENARRLDPSGFGIGLYLMKAFIESHKGKIWFSSQEGKGTTFFFSIPLIQVPTEKFLEEIG